MLTPARAFPIPVGDLGCSWPGKLGQTVHLLLYIFEGCQRAWFWTAHGLLSTEAKFNRDGKAARGLSSSPVFSSMSLPILHLSCCSFITPPTSRYPSVHSYAHWHPVWTKLAVGLVTRTSSLAGGMGWVDWVMRHEHFQFSPCGRFGWATGGTG
jgi:hypothetical protein